MSQLIGIRPIGIRPNRFRRNRFRLVVGLLVVVALAAGAFASRRSSARRGASSAGPGVPGVFDLYLLSLSWSPEHCASPAGASDGQQCGEGRRYGFIVHGLWPQFERGWPQDCPGDPRVAPNVIQRMLPIMPSRRLIEHEWATHGTCSGLGQQQYFETIQNAFAAVRIPREFGQPGSPVNLGVADLKSRFLAANTGWNAGALRVQCSGRFLSEVRVCFTKDLKPRACPASLRDGCRDTELIMRPLR